MFADIDITSFLKGRIPAIEAPRGRHFTALAKRLSPVTATASRSTTKYKTSGNDSTEDILGGAIPPDITDYLQQRPRM